MKASTEWDSVIIGAGPAGSTAAALLAEKGRRVVVFEKERFPRYHIGESLMPLCYFPLQRLGLIEELKASAYPKKFSVQFVRQDGEVSAPFYFFQHFEHEAAQTWQVVRSDFDAMLLRRARERGADVREGHLVTGWLEEAGATVGVTVRGPDGATFEARAPVTIDASGRDCAWSGKHGWRVRDPQLNKIALWSYVKGAKRDPGLDEGATTVAYLPGKGWFWYIPLPDDVVSVGIVAERDYLFRDTRDLEAIFWREVKENAWIEDHVAGGTVCEPFRTTGEYSYRSKHCASDGLVLVGDAFAFLDPVFSSGVFLALSSGALAADAVDAALGAGDVSASRFAEYGERMCRAIENMRGLVYAFYDPSFSFGKMHRAYPQLRGQLTDCLIGDLFDKEYKELFSAVGEFAQLPASLEYGRVPAPSTVR